MSVGGDITLTFHVFQEERFRRDYGPNYHPTFQVILEAGTEDVELRLLKRGDEEVWIRQVPLTGKLLFKPIQSLYCHTRIYNVDHLQVNVEGIFHHKYMFGKCISYFSLPPPPRYCVDWWAGGPCCGAAAFCAV